MEMKTGAATMENTMEVLKKKLKIELPYNLAIPLLGIYSKKENSKGNSTFIPVFMIALFIITTIGKQPKCPSTDKNKEHVVCIHICVYI